MKSRKFLTGNNSKSSVISYDPAGTQNPCQQVSCTSAVVHKQVIAVHENLLNLIYTAVNMFHIWLFSAFHTV